jgi:hypothetical protein
MSYKQTLLEKKKSQKSNKKQPPPKLTGKTLDYTW